MNNAYRNLYEHRVLVFIEKEGGVFRQAILNREQFKKVSDAIVRESLGNDSVDPEIERVYVEESDREFPADMFIGCSSVEDGV